jgi:hypothetical protein
MPVVHCKRAEYDVYIGRPSKWGNPFSHKPQTLAETKVDTRDDAIQMYRIWLTKALKDGVISLEEIAALDGKTLGCWCHPKPCHGEVLLQAAFVAAGRLRYE